MASGGAAAEPALEPAAEEQSGDASDDTPTKSKKPRVFDFSKY